MAVSTKPGDVPFASLLSGAYGSAAIALFFLVVDTWRAEPLSTPSFMGQVVLFGATPTEVGSVRLDAFALYSLVHLAAFVGIGTAVSIAYARTSLIPRSPFALALVLLAILTLGTMGIDRLLFPGIIDGVGRIPLVLGNGWASIAMTVLVYQTFEGAIRLPRRGRATPMPEPALARAPAGRGGEPRD